MFNRHLLVWIGNIENLRLSTLVVKRLLFCTDDLLFYSFVFIAVFCCQWHVGYSFEVKLDCIRHLDELVEFVENNYKEE